MNSLVDFFRWLSTIFTSLAKPQRWRCLTAVFLLFAGRISQVLAFLLPLKIILLLTSEGVPSYFGGIISPTGKTYWIVGLSALAVCALAFSFLAEMLAQGLTHHSMARHAASSVQLAEFNEEDQLAQDLLYTATRTASNILTVFVLLICGCLFNPPLFLSIAALLAIESSIVGILSKRHNAPNWNPGKLRLGKTASYFASVNFLFVFAFLLGTYYLSGELNPLVALASLIAARQLFASGQQAVGDASQLSSREKQVEKLLIRRGSSTIETRRSGLSTKTFSRESLASAFAGQLEVAEKCVSFSWVDNNHPSIIGFSIKKRAPCDQEFYWSLLYSRQSLRLARNERLLLESQASKGAHLPTLCGDFEYGEHLARIYKLPGEGKTASQRGWGKFRNDLVFDLWENQPSRETIELFQRTTRTLNSLSSTHRSHLEIYAQISDVKKELQRFFNVLDKISRRIEHLPLFLHNPRLSPNMCVQHSPDDYTIFNWGAWTLASVGSGIQDPYRHMAEYQKALSRFDFTYPGHDLVADALLGHHLYELRASIELHQLGEAFRHTQRLVDIHEGACAYETSVANRANNAPRRI